MKSAGIHLLNYYSFRHTQLFSFLDKWTEPILPFVVFPLSSCMNIVKFLKTQYILLTNLVPYIESQFLTYIYKNVIETIFHIGLNTSCFWITGLMLSILCIYLCWFYIFDMRATDEEVIFSPYHCCQIKACSYCIRL